MTDRAVHLHKFFKSNDTRNDPWKVFSELREQGPLIKFKMPFIGYSWGVTTFDSVSTVMKDDERFVRDPINAGRKTFIRFQWMLPRVMLTLVHNMLGSDGQKHRRLRGVVDKAFARQNIAEMSTRLESLADRQLDVMAAAANADGSVDLMEHFMRPYPLNAICDLLGLPEADRAQFRIWFEPFSTVSSVFGMFKLGGGLRKVVRYFGEQFNQVRKNPREGLLSDLVQIEHEGEQLNEQELMSMAGLLLIAGHETTVHLISNFVMTLFQHEEVKNELMSDWSQTDAATDEILRYNSPLQIAKPRYIARDMNFLGHDLKRGELITPVLASANYDPDRFENPLQFNMHRERNYHMSFGSGPHTCLGMKLAKAETYYAIKGLLERWPDMQPGFDLSKPDWSPRPATRGFKSMMVKLR